MFVFFVVVVVFLLLILFGSCMGVLGGCKAMLTNVLGGCHRTLWLLACCWVVARVILVVSILLGSC